MGSGRRPFSGAVSERMARRIRVLRERGLTWRVIATRFGITESSAKQSQRTLRRLEAMRDAGQD